MPILSWSLTIGNADVSPYVINGARFVETASSTQGLCTCTINGAHAEIVPGASILLASSDGTPLWEGVVTTAAPQYDSSGTQIATMLLGSPLSSQLDVGTHYVATTAVDISDLAVALCSQAPVPFGSQGDLGSSGGALSIRNVASGLTVAALISRKHWRVQNGSVTFVGPETMQSLSAPLSGSPVSTSSVVVSGGLDAQTKQPLQAHFPTVSGTGAAFFAEHPELSDASTLAAAGAAYAQRFPSVNASMTLDAGTAVRAGDWFVDPLGVTAHAHQVEHRLVAGTFTPTVQFGYSALPLASASDTVSSRSATHPASRLANDFLVTGATVSVSGLNFTLSGATIVLLGAKVPAIAGAPLSLPPNATVLVTAGPGGFAQSTDLSLPAPGTAVALYLVTTNASQIVGWEDLAPRGGVGSYHLKNAPPATVVTISGVTVSLAAEGQTLATATLSATLAGVSFDDTINTIEATWSIAGQNKWHPGIAVVHSPNSGAVTAYIHGLGPGQAYDLAFIVRDHAGNMVGGAPILASPTGISPSITAAQIGATLGNEFGGTLNGDGSWTNVDGKSSATGYVISPSGSVFSASLFIQKGATNQIAEIILGNQTNGYGLRYDTAGTVTITNYVTGVVTFHGSVAAPANDLNYHSFRLTVVHGAGNNNTVEASFDELVLAIYSDNQHAFSGPTTVTLFTAGSTGKALHYEATTTAHHYTTLPGSYQGNFDSAGKIKKSTTFISTTPNTVAYVSDATIEFSWSGTGPYSVKIWFDSGTAGADSTVIWPDGTPSVNLGHTTSASPSFAASSIPASTNYYAVLHVQNGVVTMTVQTTPFTTAQFAAYFADGGIVPAAAQAGTPLFTASGSGGSGGIAGGGGGHNLRA